MAKSPVTKTANIVLPIAGLGILLGVGYFVYTRFFAEKSQEEQNEEFFGSNQSAIRDEKGFFGNVSDFFFGDGTNEQQTANPTPNPQTANTTPNLDGGSSIFSDIFGGISNFFFPKQEGQSSPTKEKDAVDSTPSTTDPTGTSTAPVPNPPTPDENVTSPQGNRNKKNTSVFQQTGVNLRDLQKNFQTFNKQFRTKTQRGGRIFSVGNTSNPTTSNASSSTNKKDKPSTKDVTTQNINQTNSKVSRFISSFSNKPVGTSRTSPKSSGSPTSSTSTTEKPKTSTPTGSGRRSGNTRTTNSGTGQTDKTQTRQNNFRQSRKRSGRR